MSKLHRILFLQGQRCFFCDQAIPKGEESLEHIVPQSEGGRDTHNNVVVCCKTLNVILSNLPVKEKLRVVLQQRDAFACPILPGKLEAKAAEAAKTARKRETIAPRNESLGLVWPEKLAP